ncbi:YbaB/EbfC family nucleoid-associated protein [Nonomuraea sp. NPDC047897]|uniref:YbaB/EbfC family nucleoid-associated protein n=1 Tax=Nonomuraea sp. NPDC047897 TaxID=3364346 RepID=UPI0037223BEB
MTPPVDPFPASGDEELDRLLEQFSGDITALQQLQQRIADVRGHGVSEQGRVTAETSLTGALVGLTIDPRAMRLGSAELAEAVLRAAGRATADAERQAKELVGPFLAGTPLDTDR